MRKWLILLIVLVLLVVGVDLGGRVFAESKAGEAISARTGMAAVDVNIHGFSFLAQALPGNYSHITLTAPDQVVGPLTGLHTALDLYGVHLPLSDAVKGNVDSLTADRADLKLTIPTATLGKALGYPGLTISPGAADGEITMQLPVTVQGHQVTPKATFKAQVVGTNLRLAATKLEGVTGAPQLDAELSKVLTGISLDLPLTDLPVRITGASISALPDAVQVSAQAEHVSVADLR